LGESEGDVDGVVEEAVGQGFCVDDGLGGAIAADGIPGKVSMSLLLI